jgi:hypothetical protein
VTKSNAELIRLRARRAKIMLDNALINKSGASWRTSLPPPDNDDERRRYEELSRAADAVGGFTKSADPTTISMMLDYAFLQGIADGIKPGEWYLRHYQPILKTHRKKETNRKAANARRHDNAGPEVLAELAAWRKSNPGLSAKQAVSQFQCGRRKADRLRKLLKAGKIPAA